MAQDRFDNPARTSIQNSSRGCPICAEKSAEILHSARFVLPEGHPLGIGYNVVCCIKCGFVFADTTAGQKEFDDYYQRLSKYEDAKTSTGGGDNPSDRVRLLGAAQTLATAFPDRSTRFMDIGCATGGLLATLQELGYRNLCGIDPSPQCCELTKRRTGSEAYVGTFSAIPQGIDAADVITLTGVLEHVHDVRHAIRTIRECLSPSGSVYVDVPDATGYLLDVVAPFQDFNTEHINHFSLQSLSNLMSLFGFASSFAESRVLVIDGVRTPSIHGIWNQIPEIQPSPLLRDEGLKPAILQYITESKDLMQRIEGRLTAALHECDEIVVWGTGQLLMKLLAETSLGTAKIAAFIDGNSINHGKRIHGVPVLAPNAVLNLGHPIIIASTIHQQMIADRIRNELRAPNRIITLSDRPISTAS